jgi:hypothetical protein
MWARIFHRHDALALPDEYARSHDHQRFVADDDARVRRGEARSAAVGPGDSIAGEIPRRLSSHVTSTPTRVQVCAAAGATAPSPKGAMASRSASARWMVMPCLFGCGGMQTVVAVDRSGVHRHQPGENAESGYLEKIANAIQSVMELNGAACRTPLQKTSCPFKRGPSERWPSGLRRTLGKRVCGKLYRGFESHSLRHIKNCPARTHG